MIEIKIGCNDKEIVLTYTCHVDINNSLVIEKIQFGAMKPALNCMNRGPD